MFPSRAPSFKHCRASCVRSHTDAEAVLMLRTAPVVEALPAQVPVQLQLPHGAACGSDEQRHLCCMSWLWRHGTHTPAARGTKFRAKGWNGPELGVKNLYNWQGGGVRPPVRSMAAGTASEPGACQVYMQLTHRGLLLS